MNLTDLIWNCDESGLPHEPKLYKIISAKGEKTMKVFLCSRKSVCVCFKQRNSFVCVLNKGNPSLVF